LSHALDYRDEVHQIDQEIQHLQDQLHSDYQKEMKEEVESQKYMIADWEAYSSELQQVKHQKHEERIIKRQIEQLYQRKTQLLKQSTEGAPYG